ncbi:hypothetical protein HBHAL_4155 [Halobacillus halophilus DSM 2266]|uniref:Uncharacterized protein n=1 Tax=Halobacillus halophilus (strain ATCC 35676 / DSM 2266 / JCM 20832 / KCTC 3685 / LMG 17431 / NBRC 102448 / NCIMB 2269) TaxID=866895 RepID=I0JQS7_HALH3|nr:hypothetical protein HBHAL_4155 [Halobacillus halophilus DSM 2266]
MKKRAMFLPIIISEKMEVHEYLTLPILYWL